MRQGQRRAGGLRPPEDCESPEEVVLARRYLGPARMACIRFRGPAPASGLGFWRDQLPGRGFWAGAATLEALAFGALKEGRSQPNPLKIGPIRSVHRVNTTTHRNSMR